LTTHLVVVPGIGDDRASALADHGIQTLEQLAEATVDRIAAVPGFGPATARRSKQTAQELLLSQPGRGEAEDEKDESGADRGKKEEKEKKKDRKRRDEREKSKKRDKKRKNKKGKKRDKRKGKKKGKGKGS
jgi:hypothetical protein